MTPLEAIKSHAGPTKATQLATYHKIDRPYLGVSNPIINDITKSWRQTMSLNERLQTADQLWQTNIHEARIAAAKTLTQAHIKPDPAVWELIVSWVPDFDAWAIADHACSAGARRLQADPTRLDEVQDWIASEHMWTRRAALVITLPWTKSNNPRQEAQATRDRILGWAATYIHDHDWIIQKAVAWWVRELSKHDAPRARVFLDQHASK